MIQHARIEKLLEVRGTTGVGTAGYRYVLTDLGRDRAHAVHGHLPLRRPGAGAARAVQRVRARLHGGAPAGRPRPPRDRLRVTSSSARRCSTSSVRRSTPASRSSSTARPATARPSSPRGSAARSAADMYVPHADRRRRPDDHHVRSGQPPPRRGHRGDGRASSPARRSISAGSRSGVRSWSSAAS